MPASRSRWITTSQGQWDRDELSSLILAMRDQGRTLQECADRFGLATRQIARQFWIRGLRNAGRANEIQTRQLNIQVGGRQFVIDTNDLADTLTFAGEGWTTFGVEIECFALGQRGSCDALRQKNLDAEVESYNHTTRRHWKVTTDSSIMGGAGAEVVSPILRGNDGLKEMRTAMMALRESGARINSSCGGHIHIGVDGWLSTDEQANVIERWWLVARALEMLFLKGRRGGQWARRLTKQDGEYIARAWREGNTSAWGERYKDLNTTSFGRYGTFEVRSHNGSLNGLNHGAWVIINQAVMRWLADADLSVVEALWSPIWIEQGSFEIRQFGSRDVVPDAECRIALERLLGVLKMQGLITEEVARHALGRAEWIARRADRGGQGI